MSFDEPARLGGAATIGFVAALGVECASLRRQARAASWTIEQSGPGAARASVATARAIEAGARLVVSWGLAGALDTRLAPGTVVVARRVVGADMTPLDADAGAHARLVTLADEFTLDQGDLLTVPAALESPAAKRSAAMAARAVAVDMESAAIAAAAAAAGVPFVALRVIVDGVEDALPRNAEAFIDERGERRAAAVLRAAVSPAEWRGLLVLAKRYRVASAVLDRLARALASRGLLAADVAAARAGS